MPIAIHLHKRKRRTHKNLEPYPSNNTKIRFLDGIVSVVSFAAPLTIAPQIYNIWIKKNIEGVSMLTWIFFLIFAIPLFTYSSVHKDKKLMLMYFLFMIADALVVAGILFLK